MKRLRLWMINRKIEKWHKARPTSRIAQMPLHEYLGMTWDEYRGWIKNPREPRGHG